MLYCNLFNIQLRFYLRIFSYVFRRIIVTQRWISMLRDEFLTIFCRSTKFNFRWKVAADWFIRFSSIDKIEVTLIFWRKKGKLEKKWPFETRLFDTLMLFRPAMSEIVSCFFCLEKRRERRRKTFREQPEVRVERIKLYSIPRLSYDPGFDILNSLSPKE